MRRSLLLHPQALGLSLALFLLLVTPSPLWTKLLVLCLFSLHPALPPSHQLVDAYSQLICSRWPELSMRSLESCTSPRCFVLTNAKSKGILSQAILAWALLVQSLHQKEPKTVYVVTALPLVCNAPLVRIWFQCMGFVDYRTMSVEKIKSKDCFVLMFDAALAAEYFTAQYIVDCSVILRAARACSTPPVRDP